MSIQSLNFTISLKDVLPGAVFLNCEDIVVRSASSDSRSIQSGDLYVAIRGRQFDGHRFIHEAASLGASGLLLEVADPNVRIPQCLVRDTRQAWSRLTLALKGNPERHLLFAGITGTNGKTTTAWILRSILQASQLSTGLLGTVEYHDSVRREPATLTTPDSATTAEWLQRMRESGASHCVMEISSHALDQSRCCGIPLSVAAITNVTHDHFDYHGTYDLYLQSKVRIHEMLIPGAPLLLNANDRSTGLIKGRLNNRQRIITFGESAADDVHFVLRENVLILHLLRRTLETEMQLFGQHNAMNCLVAAAMAEELGVTPECIACGINHLEFVPGRLQSIESGQPFRVFVDFAHTPDGLAQCILTVRSLTKGRVILVFGAGGDRDRGKRPAMAQASASADVVIVTSDNPRAEDPDQIIADVLNGFADFPPEKRNPGHSETMVKSLTDRRVAIEAAIEMAEPEDSVIIAGRGHEPFQQWGHKLLKFDDSAVALEILQSKFHGKQPSAVCISESPEKLHDA
ncbi:MAG: UDP-N-acetylmuramoyl-L-alanyl-D-glutamate--2,6-diaminopimelate ligase [Planctomycetaceae bacterium]